MKGNGSTKNCPEFVTKSEAHSDIILPEFRQYGKMACYCKKNILKFDEKFTEFKKFNWTNYENLFTQKPFNEDGYGFIPSQKKKLDDAINNQKININDRVL